jgi:hypothetical protein
MRTSRAISAVTDVTPIDNQGLPLHAIVAVGMGVH